MTFKITHKERNKLETYLKEFYKFYRKEKYTVFHFVRDFKRRLKDNKDAWLGVSGDTGSGKSYFVIMSQILFGRPYNLVDNISYIPKGDEIVDKFKKLRFQTFLVDEAAKEMRSVNWQSKAQQGVNVTAMTDRYLNNMVFLNMPNFNEFTKSMRASNLLFRVIIPYRTSRYARVFLQRKSRNWRDADPWGDKYADERYQKIQRRYKEITNDHIDNIERSTPNYVMDFIVPNLELILPKITAEYQRLKEESRIVTDESDLSSSQQKNIWKEKYKDFFAKVAVLLDNHVVGKDSLTKKQLCDELGVSQDTFNKYKKMPKGTSSKALFHKKLVEQTKSI